MKKNEYRLKSMLYGAINSLLDEKDGIIALIQKLGDAPTDEHADNSTEAEWLNGRIRGRHVCPV